MSEPSADRDPFEGVAESFLARFRPRRSDPMLKVDPQFRPSPR